MQWYHLSDTWIENSIIVSPRTGRVDDVTDPRDTKPFIACCPSIEQCIIAIGEWYDLDAVNVYVAETETIPENASWVFDNSITDEHRFYEPTKFIKTSVSIDLQQLQKNSLVKVRHCAGKNFNKILQNLQMTLDELRILKLTRDDHG